MANNPYPEEVEIFVLIIALFAVSIAFDIAVLPLHDAKDERGIEESIGIKEKILAIRRA